MGHRSGSGAGSLLARRDFTAAYAQPRRRTNEIDRAREVAVEFDVENRDQLGDGGIGGGWDSLVRSARSRRETAGSGRVVDHCAHGWTTPARATASASAASRRGRGAELVR